MVVVVDVVVVRLVEEEAVAVKSGEVGRWGVAARAKSVNEYLIDRYLERKGSMGRTNEWPAEMNVLLRLLLGDILVRHEEEKEDGLGAGVAERFGDLVVLKYLCQRRHYGGRRCNGILNPIHQHLIHDMLEKRG